MGNWKKRKYRIRHPRLYDTIAAQEVFHVKKYESFSMIKMIMKMKMSLFGKKKIKLSNRIYDLPQTKRS